MAKMSAAELEDLQDAKKEVLKDFLEGQPPNQNGEDLIALWEKLYDEDMKNVVVKTVNGPSHPDENPVFPYEKLQAVLGDGGNWKWPRMWQRFDEVERRGEAYREGEALNFKQENKNPNIISQNVLVVGGGPIGLRLAIELAMGGHVVTLFEKRRTIRDDDGSLKQLGFTNRINRPHMWPFVRNDLAKLNGKDFMSRQAAYPVFTEPDTMSIGIDELQCLLIKNALMLGVDIRLGVGYEDAKIRQEEGTCRPYWEVSAKYDKHAAEIFGMEEGINKVNYDCLVGCDGPRSTVRDTQKKFFGNVEKRKFMDCVGIVANVGKVPKNRLKELGFDYGQEPGDMNKTKMVFKEFFGKIQKEADADIENLIYYKASNHNYTILVPKRADLIKHGLSGKVYSFHEARSQKGNEEKAKLKEYCRNVLKAAGIPIDEAMPNGGFVGPPNDCMAFDFAECWNTKISLAFNLPPPDYDEEEDGEWQGRKLIPLVALAGDALLEPFWPMGLGLKRGWQAVMDTCYAIDNLYNRTLLAERKGCKDLDEWSWEEHYDALKEQCSSNFEMCNRLQVSAELAKGEYDDKGVVMTQLKKMYKDAEKPTMLVEINPWLRYEPLEKENGDAWKSMNREEKEAWVHPIVKKAIAMKEFYDENSAGGKNGEIDYKGKELISINGKVIGGFKQAGKRTSLKQGKKKPGAAPKSRRGKTAATGTGAAVMGDKEEPGSMAAALMSGVKKPAKEEPKEEEPKEDPKKKEETLAQTRAQISSLEADLAKWKRAEQVLLETMG